MKQKAANFTIKQHLIIAQKLFTIRGYSIWFQGSSICFLLMTASQIWSNFGLTKKKNLQFQLPFKTIERQRFLNSPENTFSTKISLSFFSLPFTGNLPLNLMIKELCSGEDTAKSQMKMRKASWKSNDT